MILFIYWAKKGRGAGAGRVGASRISRDIVPLRLAVFDWISPFRQRPLISDLLLVNKGNYVGESKIAD
jgi:hypothetical protein